MNRSNCIKSAPSLAPAAANSDDVSSGSPSTASSPSGNGLIIEVPLSGFSIDEADLVGPRAAIDQEITSLMRRVQQVEEVGVAEASTVKVALMLLVACPLAELLAMKSDLQPGMSMEAWALTLVRTAQFASDLKPVHKMLCDYLDEFGLNLSDDPFSEAAGQ